MKMKFLGLLLSTSASAQEVVSQLGGFSEQVAPVPAQAADPLSLFLQQAPPAGLTAAAAEPSFPVQSINPFETIELANPMPPTAAPQVQQKKWAKPKGVLTLRSMRVSNPGKEGSKILFGPRSEFAMGTDAAGNFIVEQASAPAPLLSLDNADTLRLGAKRVEARALDASQGISVRGVNQWQLVQSEDFSKIGAGWSRPEVTQCAGVFMLGGFCKLSRGEVNKTFTGLPPHKQLRIVATYHFIDRWIGETGYMKLNVGMSDCPVVVWSERHAQQEAKNGLSLCGDAGTPEGKFSAPVDVTMNHRKDSVQVSFGSTMDDADPCDESWGISNMEIYVRD